MAGERMIGACWRSSPTSADCGRCGGTQPPSILRRSSGVEAVVDEELGGELAADGDEVVDGDLGTAQELGEGLSGDGGGAESFGERWRTSTFAQANAGRMGHPVQNVRTFAKRGAEVGHPGVSAGGGHRGMRWVSSCCWRWAHALLLGLEVLPGFVADEADAAAMRGEAAVGVVDAQVKAELGAGGEHAVGLAGSLADEIVDEDGGVGFAAIEDEGRLTFDGEGGVDSGHESLAGGFLVAAGSVDLSAEVEAADFAGFEGAFELGGVDGVVLDGVAGAEHLGGSRPGMEARMASWTSTGSEVLMPLR